MRPDDYPYMVALSLAPQWANKKVNEFIERVYLGFGVHPADFFSLPETEWWERFGLQSGDVHVLSLIRGKAAAYEPLTTSLYIQGFGMVIYGEKEYPAKLRQSMLQKAPPLLYLRGERSILQTPGVAILGQRNCSERSLRFAEATAVETMKNGYAVIGGFEKEIDFALVRRVVQAKGCYIGVLPQGLFTCDLDQWEKPIQEGNLLLLSTLHPKAQISPVRSHSIHPLIYGLAEKVYIAETANRGRTYEGALEGLKNGSSVLVRVPADDEQNGNTLLLDKGAQPVIWEDIPAEPAGKPGEKNTCPCDPNQMDWLGGTEAACAKKKLVAPVTMQESSRGQSDEQTTLFEILEG